MAQSKKQTMTQSQVAVPLTADAELGLAMLIAEGEDGHYEPVAVASTIREAKELAGDDLRSRMHRIERGEDRLCPARYLLWARGGNGDYRVAFEIGDLE